MAFLSRSRLFGVLLMAASLPMDPGLALASGMGAGPAPLDGAPRAGSVEARLRRIAAAVRERNAELHSEFNAEQGREAGLEASAIDASGIDTAGIDGALLAATFLNGPGVGWANGGFRNGGFRNGGFYNGGFRNGGFYNGGFRNGGFRNGGFRNGGFLNHW